MGKCATAVLQCLHGQEQCEQCCFSYPNKCSERHHMQDIRNLLMAERLVFSPSLASRQIKVEALMLWCTSQYSLMYSHSFWCRPCKHFIILSRLISWKLIRFAPVLQSPVLKLLTQIYFMLSTADLREGKHYMWLLLHVLSWTCSFTPDISVLTPFCIQTLHATGEGFTRFNWGKARCMHKSFHTS